MADDDSYSPNQDITQSARTGRANANEAAMLVAALAGQSSADAPVGAPVVSSPDLSKTFSDQLDQRRAYVQKLAHAAARVASPAKSLANDATLEVLIRQGGPPLATPSALRSSRPGARAVWNRTDTRQVKLRRRLGPPGTNWKDSNSSWSGSVACHTSPRARTSGPGHRRPASFGPSDAQHGRDQLQTLIGRAPSMTPSVVEEAGSNMRKWTYDRLVPRHRGSDRLGRVSVGPGDFPGLRAFRCCGRRGGGGGRSLRVPASGSSGAPKVG